MTPAVNYQEHWRRYKKLRTFFFLIWLGYVPACIVFTMFFYPRLHSFAPSVAFALLWMLMFAVAGMRLAAWRCPRCGKVFSRTGWYRRGILLAPKCVHCGLPKYAGGDVQQ